MNITALFLTTILVVSATEVPAPVKDTVKKDNSKYRLPNSIVPISYNLSLNFNKNTFDTERYNGSVAVKINVQEATKQIRLHSSSTTNITQVSVTSDGKPVTLQDKNYDFDNETDILTVNVKDPGLAVNTNYTLQISYDGTLISSDMYGFYKSQYDEDGTKKYLATTQFEPTYARRAFPCFDEPRFKATFNFSITYPTKLTAIFNTKLDGDHKVNSDGTVTDKFLTTPPMATYLVAFIVSEFNSTTSQQKIDGLYEHKVWSKKSSASKRGLVNKLGPQMYTALEEFTNITMTNMTLNKMDQAAIPDFAAGAMENWGLVTYREIYMLCDEQTNTRVNQSAATVIAHEFTHQWFGDYVTLNWWSELWLNEGFATYFQYHIPDKVLKDYQLSAQFVTDALQTAMSADAVTSAHPMSDDDNEINTPAEISGKFDSISYEKAGSVIRMLRHILGDDLFQAGLRAYLNKFKFTNSKGSNLLETFDSVVPKDTLPFKVSEIMETWTRKAGYPILHVAVNGPNLTFSQERYLFNQTHIDNTKWYVPISYTTSAEKNFDDTKPHLWLEPNVDNKTHQMANSTDWVIVNIQEGGYYRVNYDSASWTKIATVLDKDHNTIHVINRAQIIDDISNLARIGKVEYEKVFEILGYLKNEAEYFPWVSAINAYAFLIQRTRKTKLEGALKEQLRGIMQEVFKSVSSTSASLSHVDTLKQELIWSWACAVDHKNCTSQAEELFNKQMQNNSDFSVPVNLRIGVYCSALRTKDKDAWNYLWNRYTTTQSTSEKVIIQKALGCSKDLSILNDYLNKSITKDSGIRMQDSYSVFQAVISSNPEGVTTTLDFILNNWDKISSYSTSFNAMPRLLSLLGSYLSTDEELQKFQKFAEGKNFTGELKASADKVIDSIKSHQKWTLQYTDQLLKIFHLDGGSAGSVSASVILVLVSVFVFTLY